MNKHGVDELTLRDVDAMRRPDLIARLTQLADFFPISFQQFQLDGLSDDALRDLVRKARRKFQQMGY